MPRTRKTLEDTWTHNFMFPLPLQPPRNIQVPCFTVTMGKLQSLTTQHQPKLQGP